MGTLQRVRRLLLIRTDRLGETLLNLPAAAALQQAWSGATLTWLAHPDLAPLLSGVPWVSRVLPHAEPPGSWWLARALALALRLRAGRFDMAVVSNPKKELHLAVWLAGIPVRAGYDRKWGGLLTHRLPDRKALGDRHEVEYNLDLVRALGMSAAVPEWRLPRFEREQADVAQLLGRHHISPSDPVIAVHPWTSNPVKQWPADRYRAVIAHLSCRLRMPTVVIGGADAVGQADSVIPDAAAPVVNLTGRLSLRQLAALLQRARLLVSNDSGPVHLAAAVGTPTVVLFGTPDPAAGPRRWGPWGAGHHVVWKPSLEAISVEDVVEALERQLTASDPTHA